MGASRKLQGEIDRVLKKVQEGVDVFESIWKKVYDTENANQKEKFEGELKKEIKKLQRHRDQIKTWIQSSEIKDKKVSASYEQALVDARKIIEREMEKFKICEKETKMKAFSKEGLGQQPKTDPKEKAKSETREWLNAVVGELESQIDSFEAEIEGLSIKKGKARPPRLAHLETSISRHKAHIMKVELILRLLDNDQLSPEEVNDVKDFLDDYMERNQDDFDEFDDVDELYSSLPLDKLESLEDLVAIPPGIVKSVGAVTAPLSLKTSLTAPPTLQTATVTSPVQQGTSFLEQVEETASQENISARTPPPKGSSISSSGPPTPAGTHVIPGTTHASIHNVSSATTSAIPSAPSSARIVLENTAGAQSTNLPSSGKEDGRKSSSTLPETGLSSVGRGELPNHSSTSIPPTFGTAVPSGGPPGALSTASEAARRKIPGADELPGGLSQHMVSSLSNRTAMPQAVKGNDGSNSTDGGNVDSAATAGRVFSSSAVSGMQWRPGSSFQNQNEAGQVRGRTEIAPDQREKFLQRFQQVQQQGQSNLLGMPHLGGGSHKQFSAQQQHSILQQFNSQSSSVSHQVGLGIGSQAPGFATVSSSSLQQPNQIRQQATQLLSTGPKDTEVDPDKVEGIHQQQSSSDDLLNDPAPRSELDKHLIDEDEMKASFAFDTPGGVTGTLTESSQLSRDTDFSPGQPLQSNPLSGGIGVIGRRSVSDLGAIGNNIGSSSANSLEMHDKSYNLQMLEAAYGKLPQPKDSERAKNYTAINPAVTFASYPQVQAPIVNNPAFWQRMGAGDNGPDTLFFAFYYQQNTYQQYLAAKELKKQSWRFHRKYNTWFQRHEEPQLTTDEYEQGTYVYFDYHITNDEMHHGWCQRIKTEFTFEYNYLEDELVV